VINLDNIRLDGGTQPRAQLDWTTIASYTEDMQNGDTFPPIVAYYDGANYWLVDGFHRVHAAQQAGLTEIAADVRQGSLQEAQWHSYAANTEHDRAGKRRTNDDKRRAVEAALRHEYADTKSLQEIARHCGVSHQTVANYRNASSKFEDARPVTRNGKTYTMNTANIGQRNGHTPEADPVALEDEPLTPYEERLMEQYAPEPPHTLEPSPIPEPPQDRLAVHYRSDTPEWYTPEHIIVKAHQMLGGIDLDPASSDAANEMVQAAEYYTEHNNGLALPWRGRVWMNPPYGDVVGQWVNKLLLEYEDGNITEALALLPARPDTAWFAPLFQYPRCWVRGRLRFVGADNSAPFPSVIVYLGTRPGVFLECFGELGHVDVSNTAFAALWADYCRLRDVCEEPAV
jgi:hypothetical protein